MGELESLETILAEIDGQPGADRLQILRFLTKSPGPSQPRAADLLLQLLQQELQRAQGIPGYEIQVRAELADAAVREISWTFLDGDKPGFDAPRFKAVADIALTNCVEVGQLNDVYGLVSRVETPEFTEKALQLLYAKRDALMRQRTPPGSFTYPSLVLSLEALLHEHKGDYEAAALAQMKANNRKKAYELSRHPSVNAQVKWQVGTAYVAQLQLEGYLEVALHYAKEIGDEETARVLKARLSSEKQDRYATARAEIFKLNAQLAGNHGTKNPDYGIIERAKKIESELITMPSIPAEKEVFKELMGKISCIIINFHLSNGDLQSAYQAALDSPALGTKHPASMWLQRLREYEPEAFGRKRKDR